MTQEVGGGEDQRKDGEVRRFLVWRVGDLVSSWKGRRESSLLPRANPQTDRSAWRMPSLD